MVCRVRAKIYSGALLLVALALPQPAQAYCRTATCPGGERGCGCTVCSTPAASTCGVAPVAWQRDCIGFAFHEGGSRVVDALVAYQSLIDAFGRWEAADCGAGLGPGIHVAGLGGVECARVEYSPVQDGKGNVNLLAFRDEQWPHPNDPFHTLALTTVSFDLVTGEIFDTDIEVNTASGQLYLGPSGNGFDLASVLTHEAGHVLGLAHCDDCAGTPDDTMPSMFESALPGAAMQSLERDDQEGVCAAYPPKTFDRANCNPIPRHGYASECADEQRESGCALATRQPGDDGLLLGLVGWLAARRRRPVSSYARRVGLAL